jgi:hypothetical protein
MNNAFLSVGQVDERPSGYTAIESSYFSLSWITRFTRLAFPLPGGPVTAMKVPVNAELSEISATVRLLDVRPELTWTLAYPTQHLLLRCDPILPSSPSNSII